MTKKDRINDVHALALESVVLTLFPSVIPLVILDFQMPASPEVAVFTLGCVFLAVGLSNLFRRFLKPSVDYYARICYGEENNPCHS